MYILSIIPLTKIPRPAPQTLDYFSHSKADVGAIARVQVGKRKVLGVVISLSDVKRQKQQIKKSRFLLKSVEEVINPNSIIPKSQLEIVLWVSSHYYTPIGLVLKSLLPRIFSKSTKGFLKDLATKAPPADKKNTARIKEKPLLLWSKIEERAAFYEKEIKKAKKNKQSVLFLVPELYKIDYFKNKIPALKGAITAHSRITPKNQYGIWEKSVQNAGIIIGTRAALALSPKNLGLIILDSEESDSHKSYDQAPYINARSVALKLAEITSSKIILGSSIPSMESFYKARQKEYELKTVRNIQHTTYDIRLIDMREELKNGNYSIFSKKLQTQLIETIKNNEQSILFINRRGLSTGLLCRDCGYIIKCPNCDVALVYHREINKIQDARYKLICHHCGQRQKPHTVCPKCNSYKIKFMGAGTQRVEEELKKLLTEHGITNINYRRLDSDIASVPEIQKEALDAFRNKEYSILIGTQLMLKEGLLPNVQLVSVITADPLLSLPDFRINELILQTVDKLWTTTKSTILFQTYIIDNYVFNNVLNKPIENTLSDELRQRKSLKLPPFSQLIKLSYGHNDTKRAEQEAKVLKNKIQTQASNFQFRDSDFQLLGPAPAFIPRQNNRYIWKFLIKSKLDIIARNKLLSIVPNYWKIDVEPIEIL